jgi:DNA-binding NtrC family response regulator
MKSQEILLVDDNIDLAENMCEILTQEGFIVAFFDNPTRALEAFSPDSYGLALLDMQMPDMDGIELYRRLKEVEPSLNAIAITANANEEQINAAIEEGVLAVLLKPINITKLLDVMRNTQQNKPQIFKLTM